MNNVTADEGAVSRVATYVFEAQKSAEWRLPLRKCSRAALFRFGFIDQATRGSAEGRLADRNEKSGLEVCAGRGAECSS